MADSLTNGNSGLVSTTKSATATKIATELTNTETFQSTIDAVLVNQGILNAVNATVVNTTRSANATLRLNALKAEIAKQTQIDAARDAVRGTYLANS